MSNPALVVPVKLDALVVNNKVTQRDAFRRWQMNYGALSKAGKYNSPEPGAFDHGVKVRQTGVHLHWTLPDALRHGTQQGGSGPMTYPLVPNRWLVVRLSGTTNRAATGWVVESDCPFGPSTTWLTSDRASMYLADPDIIRMWKRSGDKYRKEIKLDPDATEPQVANIGISFPLKDWSERDAAAMFLTALGPANPVFSIYAPHNAGVFSIIDTLDDVDPCTLSYTVIGWYSDAAKDILASWPSMKVTHGDDAYVARLQQLGWAPDKAAVDRPVRSVYQGLALDVAWDVKGDPPNPDPLESIRDASSTRHLDAALGNTTIDAFTALVRRHLQSAGYEPRVALLLRALQYDVLRLVDRPNGDALLDRAIRDAWHRSVPGGLRWALGEVEPGNKSNAATITDPDAWVAALNAAQATLDDALGELVDRQWQLNALWLKAKKVNVAFPKPPVGAPSIDELNRQLDPELAGTLAARTVAALKAVQKLLGTVPQPDPTPGKDPQTALADGVAAFQRAAGLPAHLTLKPVAAPRYWQPNDPVLVLSGLDPPGESIPDAALAVRTLAQVATSLAPPAGRPITAAAAIAAVPLDNATGLPDLAPPLVAELLLLDPASAVALAAATKQDAAPVRDAMTRHDRTAYPGAPLPRLGLDKWSQPWEPMFVEWQVRWNQVPDSEAWAFDGTDYRLTKATVQSDSRPIGGISLLGPHAQLVFRERLKTFIGRFGPNVSPGPLLDEIEKVDGWHFLAQELTGFHELLAMRDGRAFRRPTSADTLGEGKIPLPALLGYADATVDGQYALPTPARGQVTTAPYLPNGPTYGFYGVRQGQGHFESVIVYDKFGRVLEVVADEQGSGVYKDVNFPLVRDEALIPLRGDAIEKNVSAPFELGPRLLQPARLDFELVDATDGATRLADDPRANPVAGWVLPNHLDQSLLLYSPGGQSLGEYRLVAGHGGSRTGRWDPPVHGKIATLDDVAAAAPELARILRSSGLARAEGFARLLEVIDATLWTTAGLGTRVDQNLSVLVGRPLALVSAQVRLSVRGDLLRDASWKNTLQPPDPPVLTQPFAVRLGDLATRDDGLMGYFVATDDSREQFNSVAPPSGSAQTYVRQIGPPGNTNAPNYPTLKLADHAPLALTLLIDPRAGVHATTGLFPVKRLDVPAPFVEVGLSQIEATFRVEPLLTFTEPSPVQGDQKPAHPLAVRAPAPAEQGGRWTWWDHASPSVAYDIVHAPPNALLKPQPLTLWDGVLALDVDLAKDGRR